MTSFSPRIYMDKDATRANSGAKRTSMAIAMAAIIGIPFGVFLYASAVPFGPVVFGWIVALAGALVVPGLLCLRATQRYPLIGFAYAAGVATASVAASLIAPRSASDLSRLIFQFAIVFVVVGATSLIATGLYTLLKSEDQRAQAKEELDE